MFAVDKRVSGKEGSTDPKTGGIQSSYERRIQSTLESRGPVSLEKEKSIHPGRGGDRVSVEEEDPVNLGEWKSIQPGRE